MRDSRKTVTGSMPACRGPRRCAMLARLMPLLTLSRRRTRLRAAPAARSCVIRGAQRRAHRPDRAQRHRQVDAAPGHHRRAVARRWRSPAPRRSAHCVRGAGARAAGGGHAARQPGRARRTRAHRRRTRTLAGGIEAGRIPAPSRARRVDPPGRRVGRRVQACDARTGAGAGAAAAAARRADQSPRHRRHPAARGTAGEGRHQHLHHARPRLPGLRRDADRRARPRPVALVPGQLRGLRASQGRAAFGRVGREPPLRQVLGAGRGLDPQGRRGAPHAQRGPGKATAGVARAARCAA